MTDIITPEPTGIESTKQNGRVDRLRELGDLGTKNGLSLPELEPIPELPGAEAAKKLTDIIAEYGPMIADLHARLDNIDVTGAPQAIRGSVEIAQISAQDFAATLEKVLGWTDSTMKGAIDKARAEAKN